VILDAPLAATALTRGVEKVGVVADGLLAAGVLALPASLAGRRVRALLIAAALILTPLLVALTLWHNSKLASLHHHPLKGVAAIIVALIVIGALTVLLHRRPQLFPLLAVAALPFRIPLGSISNGLLVPLYAVIAAAALSHIIRTREQCRQGEPNEEGRGSGPPQSPEFLLAAALLLYALQATYSSDLTKGIEQLAFFYVPFALLFVLLRDLTWDAALLARCLRIVVGLALLFVLVGFVEYATHHLLFNRGLDADAYFVRINSLFYDPNIYGRFLALTMIVVAAAMLFERRTKALVVAAAALLAMWAGLLLSLSESSILALLVGLAVVAVATRLLTPRTAAIAAALALVAVALILTVAGHGVNLGSGSSTNNATSGRVSLVHGGIKLFEDRPLLGYGSGSFSTQYTRHLSKKPSGFEHHEHLPRAPVTTTDSHTTLVTIAAEQGIVGLAVYLALLVACFARLFGTGLLTTADGRANLARIAVAAAFTALVVHTFFYADFLEDPTTWVLLALGTALAPRRAAQRPTATAPT
jgi:putative inorganic carbon (hco3(-)) transporter